MVCESPRPRRSIATSPISPPRWRATAAVVVLALAGILRTPHWAPDWAQWNFEGLEQKAAWRDVEPLLDELRDTPGRFANDLHEANNALGSTRVFEAFVDSLSAPATRLVGLHIDDLPNCRAPLLVTPRRVREPSGRVLGL